MSPHALAGKLLYEGIHKAIAQACKESGRDLTQYAIIGALEAAKFDVLEGRREGQQMQGNVVNLDQTITE